ncbi:RND family transporter [Mycobacterium paraense]|uniref:MMPL/RND family transporter n=1 Tax=Mycobacterium paraense TaxID=767916 RepID=UPI000A161937|nr:RND family transporter [Mycobacterium paraense]MCV7442355.1 RND family transporter [Mycobacterium paraense]
MSSRTGTGEAAKPGGIFDRIGDVVVRWPLLVIACWIGFAAILWLVFPPLMVEAGRHEQKPLPDNAPTVLINQEMAQAFSTPGKDSAAPKSPGDAKKAGDAGGDGGGDNPLGGGGSLLMILLTDENGISPADEAVYAKLVDKLHQDKADTMTVQDFLTTPQMREVLASKDGKAFILPVSFPGAATAPTTIAGYHHVKDIAKQVTEGTSLTAYVSGPLATLADATEMAMEDAHFIEIGTVAAVLIILFLIYRNVVTMLLPLLNIGASIAASQGLLSGLSTQFGLPVILQSLVLMTAVMVGAGTDYAVFLISRYHDYVRHGHSSDQAVKMAMMSIGKVITASAATVAVAFLAMAFTKLQVFSAVGPAISISVVVALLSAVTLLPALMVLAGRRGWIKPGRDLTTRTWRIIGTRVVRRPKIHLIGSLVVLIALASCTSVMRFNYDDLKTMPASVDSSKGYDAMNAHFPANALTPMVLFIKSPSHDLRSPTALADLEQMASRVSQLPGITMVRGLTRPNGEPLEQTKISFQAGEVGNKLSEGSTQIQEHGNDLDRLVNGSNQLADALAQLRDQVNGAVTSLGPAVSALTAMEQLAGGDRTINALDQGAAMTGQMKKLGDNLSMSTVNAENIAAWAGPMLVALNNSPDCNADPGCVNSRASLAAMVQANNDGTLNSIKIMAHNLQSAGQAQTVGQTLDKVQQTLTQASSAMKTIKNLQTTMGQAEQGANALADGSRAIAGGVKELVDQTRNIGSGLGEASQFLLSMKHDTDSKPSMAGFNIPPQIMTRDEFKKGAAIFLSPDGHAARYLIQSAINPFSTEAMDQIPKIIKAAQSAQPNTELSDAKVAVAGLPSGLDDTRNYYNDDIGFIVFATIIIVFLILVGLLRAVVAPLYLIGSVLLSYLSAMGLGVLVFQMILGQNLHWSLPGLSFILLVAVGADYNMLLISRIRDESPHGVRVGVIRTVGSTGGVITSAGLIFAASMFGLMTASIYTMAEAGFILGMGILIDTFLVRTITVPAMAALIGQKNWWPSHLGKSAAQVYAAHQRKQQQLEQLTDQLVRMKVIPSRDALAPATASAGANGAAAPLIPDDLLVRLKLVPPSHKSRSKSRRPRSNGIAKARSGSGNGQRSSARLPEHALPLFDLSGLPDHVTDDLRDSASDLQSPTNGNDDPYLGHSLPLFGQDFLSPRPITVGAKANGHSNGNGHSEESAADDADNSLPLFGASSPASRGANGNGHG